jgi:subfamily B ATP-binding cassette protein MsbA
LAEKLGGARLIKTFRLEDYAATRMIGSFEEILRLRMKSVRNRARLDPMLEALGGFAVAGVIALATWRISSGIATIGDFMAFISALVLAAQPTRGLGNLSVRVQEGLAACERLYAILDERPAIVDAPSAKPLEISRGMITFENVAFSYETATAVPAVRDFSLVVPGGATVALVGRSGSGKSTVMNLVPRLFDVDAGRIAIDGQDVRSVTLASLRGQIAMVSQDVTLFDDTIRANIALGRLDASEDDIVAAAKAANAHGFILEQPNGYDTGIGDRGSRLSGGQRQRIALARAILKDAPILLLDEATSALDTESERLVQAALARFTKGRTTLVIAHRLSTVQGADLICVMEDGRIVETGTHVELVARGAVYARLAVTQLAGPDPRNAV